MSIRSTFQGTYAGIRLGIAVNAVLLVAYYSSPQRAYWPLPILDISAFLYFWVLGPWYGGFGPGPSFELEKYSIVLSGGLQLGFVGFLWDAARIHLRERTLRSVRRTGVAFLSGGAFTASGLLVPPLDADTFWPLRMMRLIPAWLDLEVHSDVRTPRPGYYSLDTSAVLLVLLGAIQWGLLAFVWDTFSSYRQQRRSELQQ